MRLIETWKYVADQLNLSLEESFNVSVSSGEQLRAELLVKEFGAPNGMLIFTEYKPIKPFIDELFEQGYGFSVLSQDESSNPIDLRVYIDILSDWGWAGLSPPPAWVKKIDNEE